ncbi:MAG: ABC transporter ATP-binding protein [Phycisphaerales bacterium JB065]
MTQLQTEPQQTAPNTGTPVVIAHNLCKTFKDFWMRSRAVAVDEISFEIHPGEVFGLLGPNGSGKSTTIKMILGLLKKSSGRLAVFGKPPSDVSIKKRIGYLPEESYLYPFLNARETLEYYGKLFKLEHRVRRRRIDELLEMVGLTGVQHRQVREYSKGMQRRIGLAQALINDPEFLILDEPTTGLDPIGTKQVNDLIRHLGERGKTILLSSHLLADVEDVVDRMVILYGGKIRAAGTCEELLASRTRSVIETEALDAETMDEIRAVLERREKHIDRIHPARQKLEDLFIGLVERARTERAATSGAQHGGSTASFLVGEGGKTETSADEVIASLTEPSPSDDALETEASPIAQTTESQQDESAEVIDELLGDLYEDDATRPSGPSGPETTHENSQPDEDIDSSVIEGLLGDDNQDKDKNP